MLNFFNDVFDGHLVFLPFLLFNHNFLSIATNFKEANAGSFHLFINHPLFGLFQHFAQFVKLFVHFNRIRVIVTKINIFMLLSFRLVTFFD